MENLLKKIKQESKKTGDFNLNLIKYAQKKEVNQFLEISLSIISCLK